MSDPATSDNSLELSADPTVQALVYTLIRSVLQGLGAIGIVVPVVTDSSVLWSLAGFVALSGGAAWGLVEKFQAARAKARAAAMSAASGIPRAG